MARFEGLGAAGLTVILAVIAAVLGAGYLLTRMSRHRERLRRRAAWLEKRAEEDRLWNASLGRLGEQARDL